MAKAYQKLAIMRMSHKSNSKNGKPRKVARKVTMSKKITVNKNGRKVTTRKYYSGKPSKAPIFNWW